MKAGDTKPVRRIALLTGAVNNSGDFLIAERARGLFANYLPNVQLLEINRNRNGYSADDLNSMASSDVIVLSGGPLLTSFTAESVNFSGLIESGWFEKTGVPVVMMGVGCHASDPYAMPTIVPTDMTRALFDRLERSPYWSGTRDLESVVAMRNAGYRNFGYSCCPALCDVSASSHAAEGRSGKIVFSCGNPWMSDEKLNQHLSICHALRRAFPDADLVAACHHASSAETLARMYPNAPAPTNWVRLQDSLKGIGLRIVDVCDNCDEMKALYRDADFHLGYRVHAHVLMTSWGRPSVIIAEDGRASGFADVITGPVYASFRKRRHRRTFGERLKKLVTGCPCPREILEYDGDIAEKIVADARECLATGRRPNVIKPGMGIGRMECWLSQFGELASTRT